MGESETAGGDGSRWNRIINAWGFETGVTVLALGVVLAFVLNDRWWSIVSTVLIAIIWTPILIRSVRSFRQGYRDPR